MSLCRIFVSGPPQNELNLDVTIVIPVKSLDETALSDCLGSLRHQSFDGEAEIIVVEGGSIAQARNKGLEESRGNFIAFIDSDCVAAPDWLETMFRRISEHPEVGGVGGVSVSMCNQGELSRSIDAVFQTYLGSLWSASLYCPNETRVVNSISTSNSIYSSSVLNKVRRFDERYLLNEDTELSLRVRSEKLSLILAPESIVYHRRPASISAFSRKFYDWGISRMRSMLTDHGLVDLRVLTLFILFIFYPLILFLSFPLALALFTVYTLILLSHGIFYTIKKREINLIYLMPLLYLTQHLSYGLGLLVGLFNGRYGDPKDDIKYVIHHELI